MMSLSKLNKQRQTYLSFAADKSQIYDGQDLQKKINANAGQRETHKILATGTTMADPMRYVNNVTHSSNLKQSGTANN